MARTDDILAKYGVTRGGAAETPAAPVSSKGGAEPKKQTTKADNILAKYGVERKTVEQESAAGDDSPYQGEMSRRDKVGRDSPRHTVEKPESGKVAETSKKERLAALREEKGRLEAGLDLDGAARVQEEISKLEKDMGLSFWQRAWNTGKGAAKSSAAGMTDATRALYESGQNARTARDTETMAEYNRSLERAKYDMGVMLEENAKAPGTWTDRDIRSQQNIIDDLQRKYDAMAKVTGEKVQQKATAATAQLADTVQESAQKDIEKAKEGLGTAGKLLVDAGVAGTQMMGDAAANLVAPGMSMASMGFRGFGSGAQQARRNGATLAQQLGYGAASAGVEVLSEKLFDGLAGIYGGGAADDIVEGVIRKMAKSKNGQRALHVLASGAGEAAEEIISGAISPALESIYDGKNPLSHYSLETVTDMLHDAAVGGILGGLGGAVSVATGKYKPGGNAQTAQESAQEAAGARIAQQGTVDTAQQKAAAEAATGGNGHGTQTTTGDTLLDAIIKTMQPVTNRQAEAILNDPASAVQLGIDTGGMTKAQQRAVVKERVAQMQRDVPGERTYDPENDPLLQAVVGGISTQDYVENRNGFDSRSGTGYTENTENAALGGEQNGTQLDGAAGEGVRAGTGAVGGREYEKGQGPLGQGDLSNPGVVLVNGLADKYGVVLDNGGKGRNKAGKRSEQAQSVIERAAKGEEISLDELNSIPEIAMALEEELNGVETSSLSNRGLILQDGIKRALERGSYSGKNSDGKDTFNGAVRRGHRIDVVTGVAGSGKSSVYSNRISQEHGSRIIDTDDYRDFIPEYNGRNASLVHDEASAIKDAILERSIELGENIILSTVGDDAAKLARNILNYHALGYEVHLHLNHLPNAKAMGRVVARYVNANGEIGRLVKPELVKGMGDKPMQAYLEITGQGGNAYADTRAGKTGGKENERDRGAGRGAYGSDAGAAYREAQAALASWDAYDNDVAYGQPARFLSDISNPEVKKSQPSGTVGAAAAGFTQSDYGNLQLESSQFHSEGANAARPVDVPMYDGDGNPVSRFASNMMGAKAIPDDVIPLIQQMVADGELSYRARKNKNVRRQARASIREKGFDGAMEQLRTAVSDGKSDVDTVALGTELLVNAANAGDANAVAEIAALMQTSSTRVGQAMQYFTVLRKLSPSAQLYAIQKTVEQLNEKLDGRKNGKANGKRTSSKKKSGSSNGKENIPVSEWMTKAGELLAERLEKSPEGQNGKAKTVVDTILIDLTRYAKDYMGRTESRGSERTYEQRLSDLMENLPQYTKAVESAKANIAENYKNDPDMLAEFDEWMKNDIVSIFLSNESGKTVSVPKTLIEKFLSQTDQKGRDAVMEEIYQNVANQVPPTWKDRWDAWRYMSMLANPRTHIRNIVGNMGFQPIRVVKNELAAGMERLFNVKEKTKSFASSPAMYRAAWADYDNVGRLISGNRYSDAKSEIERRRRSFDTKALEAVSKGNSKALDLEDAAFKRITYADALAGYLTANGVKAEQLDGGTVPAELLSRARDYAASEALKATYQDENAVSRKVQEVGKSLGVVGEAILPFKKTPANILARGFEYSPAGLAKALTYDLAKVQRGEMSAAQAIDSVASGLTGTGLFALGAYLFAQGLVTGAKGDDKEDKWDELLGHQGYALELPDGTSITLDWLAPEALPFFMGAEFMSSVGEAGWTGDEIVSALLDATKSVADPIIEMSMLQGVNDLIESVKYADGSPLSAMVPSVITSYLSQAVPTVMGQIERTSEPVRMTTYTDKNSKLPTDLQYAIGRASAKTPGLDYQQIPYIDAWGRTEESGDVLVRAVNNMFNPAYMSKVDVDNVESELQRLYDATGDGSVFPSRAEKSFTVDGEDKYLSAEEYVKYAKDLGQSSYQLVRDGMSTSAYKTMRDTEKAEYISDLYSYAKASAKANAGGNALEGWQKNAKTAKRDIGVSTAEYIALYQKYGSGILSGSGYEKTKEAVGAGLTVDQYASMRNGLDRDGNGSVSQAEAKEKLDSMDFSREQKDQLWTIINKSWKKNPYAS